MKSPFVVRVTVLAATLLIAASSALSQVSVGIDVRFGPPPPPRYERMEPAPHPHAVWIRGHWLWDEYEGRYVWARGYWAPARPAYIWVDGDWHRGPRGWYWREGQWLHRGKGHYKQSPGYGRDHDSYSDRYDDGHSDKHAGKHPGRGGWKR